MIIEFAFAVMLCEAAIFIAYGLYKKRNMWSWIVAYWVILAIKNTLQIAGVFK